MVDHTDVATYLVVVYRVGKTSSYKHGGTLFVVDHTDVATYLVVVYRVDRTSSYKHGGTLSVVDHTDVATIPGSSVQSW